MINLNSQNEKFCQREKEISEFIKNNQGNINLVSVFHVEYLEKQKQFVIIMERCDSNLKDLLYKKQKLNDQEISDFLIQFLNGYKFLYNNKIVHKDIKPDNILYSKQNSSIIYKIGDFGLAKVYKNNQTTNDFSRNGTPVYSAPEVSVINTDQEIQKKLLEMKSIHAKSRIDIYSVNNSQQQKAWNNIILNDFWKFSF
ncbi:unnamed protein product (macronuclear) [Paramecium tetraurelia]|uniref:Protein kinase domain-containing protein n=1 Tax=Paramecium tetraurelia TaxID=5888 RepID=A0BVJ8_PARTE|nr:uncharacterized protein GSPATT00005811001 [Paramecium tetraurelia]CAK62565.1 unnamed protein product [Paramecium tetraurelia]|eukprot:XP_001429963.1 hypothetical protein (macronuclear) [Paramecium tetraurelia strain d4-2]